MLALGSQPLVQQALAQQVLAQSDDEDPAMRIQQLENQLRQLTGQNEELQYRNRQLEERLRLLQGGAQVTPGQAPVAQPNMATVAPTQPGPAYRQPPVQPGYGQQVAAPAPIVQEPEGVPPAPGRRRGDAFDPNQNPNAPGAPRALGGGQLPVPADAPVGAPGGRDAGEPLNLGNANPPQPGAGGALTTLPPSATPKDEFDLGIGYMERKDYALAEETMRNFAQKYPSDPLTADFAILAGREFFPAPALSRRRRILSRGNHQIRQIGESAGRLAAAGTIAGGPEGEGGRLRRARRGDAEISARLERRQSGRGPRAEAG